MTDLDLDRAIGLLNALPHMSKTIVDDTLYEKVLSFLTLVFRSGLHIETLRPLVVTHVSQACAVHDDRVTALAIRVLGQWIHATRCFEDASDMLQVIAEGITSSEAAIRCACLEACRLCLVCEEGQAWVYGHDRLITLSLLDQSSYVVAEACRLFSTLLVQTQDVRGIDPAGLILSLLYPQADQKQILSALDFCWELVCIEKEVALEYIRSKKLFHPLIPLLLVSNRMIRQRILEIFSRLFIWDNNPLKTLDLGNKEDQAFQVVSRIAMDMIKKATVLDDLLTGVSFLNTSLVLLKDTQWQHVYNCLFQLYEVCLDKEKKTVFVHVPSMIRTHRARNSILELIIRTVDTLVMKDSQVTREDEFMTFLSILTMDTCYSDARLLKTMLRLLTDTLYKNPQPELLTQSIQALVSIMVDEHTVLDCKSLSIVLDSFNHLLGHEEIGLFMISTGKPFIDAFSLKFLDTEWDTRDASIHFVGQLFEDLDSKTKLQFALNYDLPLEVFHRIQDSEPYVRASAIEVLEKMMRCKEGWNYVQQHKVARDLASKLPNLLYDTEAFVRRAAIDAILCLIQYRSCQGMMMTQQETKEHTSLCPETIKKLIQDEDTDVRIRACRLIENLWFLYQHEKQQKKKNPVQDHEITFFRYIRAGDLLIEAVNDTNRVVRIEAVRVIEHLLGTQHDQSSSVKRKVNEDDDFETDFLDTLRQVNLAEKKQTLDPEHLYQEAFDINADMMTQSIIPTDPEDDTNMLDCY